MNIGFELLHHCHGNENATEPLVVCIVTSLLEGGVRLNWELRSGMRSFTFPLNDGTATTRWEYQAVEAHVCYYCGIDFDAARAAARATLPFALQLRRTGQDERAVGMLVAATTLPERDVRELLDGVLEDVNDRDQRA